MELDCVDSGHSRLLPGDAVDCDHVLASNRQLCVHVYRGISTVSVEPLLYRIQCVRVRAAQSIDGIQSAHDCVYANESDDRRLCLLCSGCARSATDRC